MFKLVWKAEKFQEARQKARQIIRVDTLINDNFCWSKSSKKSFDSYIHWFEFIEDSAIFKPRVKQKGLMHGRGGY